MKLKGTTAKMDQFVIDTFTDILDNGVYTKGARPHYASDGTTANSKYITDVYIKFDLQKGALPISSLRHTPTEKFFAEIDWIYTDQTSDLQTLRDKGVHWWDAWALDDDSIGERYGQTVANYNIINKVIKRLEDNPFNRRSIINLWQESDLDNYAKLPPCAYEVQFDVRQIGNTMYLDCALNQRSSDFIVAGMGINQMQYVSLQMKLATHLGMEVGTFSWHCMNVHLYDRYLDKTQVLIDRYHTDDYKTNYAINEITIDLDVPKDTNFYDMSYLDFKVSGYKPMKPNLTFDMAL